MASWYGLTEADADAWVTHFGVGEDQIRHDYVISRVLKELSAHADLFVFYGGTALSRTILDGLRLSEDIDLLTVGTRKPAATTLDEALRSGLERQFGLIDAQPRLPDTRIDTQACLYQVADVTVQIQLITGDDYAPWPRQTSQVSLRYGGLGSVSLTTYTPAGFVGAKTTAWCDTTRNAPRDLYDLWALAQAGHISADAARVFRRFGPTASYPRQWMFPQQPPGPDLWENALAHLGRLTVGPHEAYEAVVAAWDAAMAELR
ncbi:MAG: nucleotidyl transferase AbiEii/AbiGii toxin family protein [Propionibacteriaceae bacterium]|jgi:hypothetical protein|nr:nucleotidyl transferase AbiEii/AbiGii toxin family protein [Propionibacteriaceae bacterium]